MVYIEGSSRSPRRTSSRIKQMMAPVNVLSHIVVGIVAFHFGFNLGGSGRKLQEFPHNGATEKITPPPLNIGVSRQLYPDNVKDILVGSSTVARDDFISNFDIGVPWDIPKKAGSADVMLFYGSESSLPDNYHEHDGFFSSAENATANCNTMKIILTEPKQEKQCIAVIPQWESFHVHHFLRLKDPESPYEADGIIPFRYVSRRHTLAGKKPQFPMGKQTSRYWLMLIDYLQKLDNTLVRLKPIATKVAGGGNTVVVMVCNFGQSELLFNFVCAARARGLDLSKVLLFATDSDIYELAKSLDIAAFDVQDAFGELPTTAAKNYGDRAFMGMMMSKVYCVHLINALGYNLLFQDVDVVWYHDPLTYFDSPASGNFDFYFQDDGAHSDRYAPYSPNSGFYYVRQNERTKYFFEVFIRMGELIIASGSHQSVLNDLLTDHTSSRGLRIKVFQRDSTIGEDFPGGFHYHKRKNFMKDVLEGRREPYIFHMSWTQNKDNKQRFYQQLGDWYLHDQCVSKTTEEIKQIKDLTTECCAVEPIIRCHYKDKATKHPCKDSPSLDRGRKSFW